MQIDKELCINCRNCLPYCPVSAIKVKHKKVYIDHDECVECGVCFRSSDCPKKAFYRDKLEYPRIIRNIMSDPSSIAPDTNIGGRGTVEMKTNDVTGRFRFGEAGVAVEVGRPGIGTRLSQVEIIAKELSKVGVNWEPSNPISGLMMNKGMGIFKKEVINEKVLSAILEFKVSTSKIKTVIDTLKSIESQIETVFVVSVISKLGPNMEDPNSDELIKLGYETRPNLKVNLGLGKPEFDFGEI